MSTFVAVVVAAVAKTTAADRNVAVVTALSRIVAMTILLAVEVAGSTGAGAAGAADALARGNQRWTTTTTLMTFFFLGGSGDVDGMLVSHDSGGRPFTL